MRSDPAAISIGGRQNVFAVDHTGHLRRWWTDPGGTTVSTAGWGPAVTVAGRPSVLIAGANYDELHAYVRNATSGEFEHWWRRPLVDDPVKHEARGFNAFTDPATVLVGGREHLFSVGSLDRLWDHWKDGATTGSDDWGQ